MLGDGGELTESGEDAISVSNLDALCGWALKKEANPSHNSSDPDASFHHYCYPLPTHYCLFGPSLKF